MNPPSLPYPQMPGNDFTQSDLLKYGDARAAHARKVALTEALTACETRTDRLEAIKELLE